MKKLFSLGLVLCLAVAMLTGCGSGTTGSAGASGSAAGGADSGKDVSKEASTAQSGGSQGSAKGVMPAIAKDKIKVGVIHITDPAEGSGYTYTHDLGIQGMQKALGLSDSQIVRKNNIPDTDPAKAENAILECIEEGCNVIFATSYNYMDTCEKLAAEYPEVIFSHGTGYKSNGKNFNNYFGRIYQSRYLAGIAAGLKTASNKIGYVAAMGQDNSEVTGGLNAFAMGIYSVNPEAKVFVKVTNSWFDPEGESQAAKALLAEGCDVIGQHCDTPNPQLAAEEAGVWGVGYNSDMTKDAPKAVLCSVMWDWSVYYTKAVQDAIDGTWAGENYFGGMKDGLVVLSELSGLNNPEAAAKIDEAKKKILSGEFNVFDGVIETNTGSTVGKEGSTLSDADITGGINWYFKTITVK